MLRRIALSLIPLLALVACVDEPEGRPGSLSPRSLADTEVDGSFSLDSSGRFVFDERAQQAFDYFLTADEELSADELHDWVEAELDARLPEAARDDALAAWHAYLGFRAEAAAALADSQADLAEVEQRLLDAADEQLGQEPIAAIEREQITRAFALHRALELDGAARELALAELGGEAEGFEGSDAGRFLAGRRTVAEAEATGASAEQIHVLRSEQFGTAAADRLAALDAERAAWDTRVAEFRGARDELRNSFVGSPAELDQQISRLEAERFSASELRRVRALDKLATQ